VTMRVERPHPGGRDGSAARLFNIGHGSPVKLMDFVRAVERALGAKAQVELAPMQAGDVRATYASTDRLRAEIGYQPATAIEAGVGRFIEWYRAHYADAAARPAGAAA
jgi:UDP-glucuronate 4-epimerase